MSIICMKVPNSKVVERADSHHQLSGKELASYIEKLKEFTGSSELPAVVYKGQTIPRRTMSDYSYLNSTPV